MTFGELSVVFDDAQKISRPNASSFNNLEGLKMKTNNQRRLGVTSQEPFDV